MAAAKYGNPIATTNQTVRQYNRKWVLSGGVWTWTPYQYRDTITIEYRQMCDRDYAKEAIGSPGEGYEVVTFDKVAQRGPFAELVTVWATLKTLTWNAYPPA